MTFKNLKYIFETKFHFSWFENVFRFVVSIINFNDLFKKTLRFSRCKSFVYVIFEFNNCKRFRSTHNSSTIYSITRSWHQKHSFRKIHQKSFVKLLWWLARKNRICKSKHCFLFKKKQNSSRWNKKKSKLTLTKIQMPLLMFITIMCFSKKTFSWKKIRLLKKLTNKHEILNKLWIMLKICTFNAHLMNKLIFIKTIHDYHLNIC